MLFYMYNTEPSLPQESEFYIEFNFPHFAMEIMSATVYFSNLKTPQ